jgi:hypothetical protein
MGVYDLMDAIVALVIASHWVCRQNADYNVHFNTISFLNLTVKQSNP